MRDTKKQKKNTLRNLKDGESLYTKTPRGLYKFTKIDDKYHYVDLEYSHKENVLFSLREIIIIDDEVMITKEEANMLLMLKELNK